MKAIVFATKMGGGHMSAANAVANALIQRGCASEVCDFLTLIGKRTSDIVGGAYISLVRRSPNAFGKLYRAGQFVSTPRLKSIVYFANTLYAAPIPPKNPSGTEITSAHGQEITRKMQAL